MSLGVFLCAEDSELFYEKSATLRVFVKSVIFERIDGGGLTETDSYPSIKDVLVALVINYVVVLGIDLEAVVGICCAVGVKRTVNDRRSRYFRDI
mgnify:CR=1 FL=1